ncbi:hypothetical protein AX766_04220 [Flavobacterium covae]|uniref:Mu transposase C-terminal domain-containing protein n=1 Tax=Flavobacterium covae TaxID=2906076 RepID=UPI0007C1CAAD|nr:Mu transposase C-terminal domain-containing protein [Flavobacterium covae]AND63643.1 hypothetical protein AX766_04080 [Flavobacterium covae]AND63670.1 hypothetical protein AX766_04220 [Flavobacterium covae]
MYINQSILEKQFCISKNLITTSCKRYRQGKSKSWENIKDPTDNRKVLINLDSIPEATRKKYNIPTGIEYYEAEQLRRSEEEAKKKELLTSLKNDKNKSLLYDAYKNNYVQYIPIYQEFFKNNKKTTPETIRKMACNHAFWIAIVKITEKSNKTASISIRTAFQLYSELANELDFSRYFTKEPSFRTVLTEFKTRIANKECLASLVTTKHYLTVNRMKTNDYHKGLAIAVLGHPNKYTYGQATDIINYHCIEENQNTINESWVKRMMAYDNHFRTLVIASRNGEKFAKENFIQHAVRENTPFPANIWMIDGSPLQFYCHNESKTKLVRLNLFIIIDVCSRKVVGFDISYSENKYNVLNALKMAVMEEGHLPAEIVSDNFTASKTEEIEALKEQMEKLGTVWRHAKVGNAQDKSYVERWFGSFQSVECSLYDDYIGEGIMSKRDNRRTAEQLLANSKKSGIPTFNQMKDRVITMIITYNQREKKQKSPKEVYKTLPKPNARELDAVKTSLLFWNRTKATVRKSMIKIVVNKTIHFFELKDHKLSTELQGKQVFVRYDENDLDSIMLFDLIHERVICECKKAIRIVTGQIDRTDEDLENIYKLTAKQKSKKEYLSTEKEKVIQSALKQVNKDRIDLIHPRSLAKNRLTELDDLEQQERLRNMFKIIKEEEQEEQSEPLLTIQTKEKNYIDIIEQKKPLKGVKPTFANID